MVICPGLALYKAKRHQIAELSGVLLLDRHQLYTGIDSQMAYAKNMHEGSSLTISIDLSEFFESMASGSNQP